MDGHVFHCLHCGQRYALNLPCPINVSVAAMNAFVDLHEHCADTRVDAEYKAPETPDDDPDFREVGQ